MVLFFRTGVKKNKCLFLYNFSIINYFNFKQKENNKRKFLLVKIQKKLIL